MTHVGYKTFVFRIENQQTRPKSIKVDLQNAFKYNKINIVERCIDCMPFRAQHKQLLCNYEGANPIVAV